MKIQFARTAVVVAILCSFEMSFAESCPLGKSLDLTMQLADLSKQLEFKALTFDSAAIKQGESLLVQIDALEKVHDPNIVGTVDGMAKNLTDKALEPLKQSISAANKDIENKLSGTADIGVSISQAYNDGLKVLASPANGEKEESLIQQAKDQIATMKAYPKYIDESNQLVRDLLSKLTNECLPKESSFNATIEGKSYSFSQCAQVSAFEPEAEMWGGKIEEGNCRHIVSCSSIVPEKTGSAEPDKPVLASAGTWVLDCKKQANSCPEVEKCASQVQAGEGKLRESQREKVSR